MYRVNVNNAKMYIHHFSREQLLRIIMQKAFPICLHIVLDGIKEHS